jgi:hypothetical protein
VRRALSLHALLTKYRTDDNNPIKNLRLKPDVLKPDVLKPDVLWVYQLCIAKNLYTITKSFCNIIVRFFPLKRYHFGLCIKLVLGFSTKENAND